MIRPDIAAFDASKIRDISAEVMDENGRMRVLPAAYWHATSLPERALFGHRHGIYSFPTVELVDYLRDLIDNRSAIEIGAGHGVLADALGIPGTDSYQQDREPYRTIYERIGQPRVKYGPAVIMCDAVRAVRALRPAVVIGCWVTHIYDPNRHQAGGNEAGVAEERIVTAASCYVSIGNERTHRGKRIWTRPHQIEYPPWLFSRAHNGSRDFIARWER